MTTPSSMNASRPTTQSAPSVAPARTWARCQIDVPGPTVTSGSRSALAWTRADGSITGRGLLTAFDGSTSIAEGPRIPGPGSSSRRARSTAAQQSHRDAHGGPEGEGAAPVEQGLDV